MRHIPDLAEGISKALAQAKARGLSMGAGMNDMTCFPTSAQKREMALAELRVERMRVQLVVTQIDFLAAGVQAGLTPPDSVPLMLAELYGTAEGGSE